MRLNDIISESIEDKGIFKAVFFAGLPGSGKSTVAARITDGAVSPRIVNTDKSYEFLAQKSGMVADNIAWALLGPRSQVLNSKMLVNYLNSMLPLFVDGTSANPSAMLRRTGLLDSIGYDTMMIWVSTSLETAMKRSEQRERQVDVEYIEQVFRTAEKNKKFYSQRFGGQFIDVDNNADNFSAMEGQVYGAASKFFSSPVSNPIGANTIEEMRMKGEKYLIPNVYSEDYLNKVINTWYMS